MHFTWDTGNEPVLTVANGDTVVFETRDVSDNQIGPDSDVERDRGRSTGIACTRWRGRWPSRAPSRGTRSSSRSSTSTSGAGAGPRSCPGLGLLSDDFTEPYLRIFDLSLGDRTYFRDDIVIPLTPFFGTMGVCPAGASAQPVMPPGGFGGNLDTRQLTAGTTLYLPVHEKGALFSCGDAHGCQGDGEICVTGLESPMYATLRFSVEKRSITFPQYRTPPGSLTKRVDHGAWFATTGVGGDLYENAQNATRGMLDHLTARYGLSREDAYLLCSLAVDLKISEIVDAGVFVVSAFLPEAIFTS